MAFFVQRFGAVLLYGVMGLAGVHFLARRPRASAVVSIACCLLSAGSVLGPLAGGVASRTSVPLGLVVAQLGPAPAFGVAMGMLAGRWILGGGRVLSSPTATLAQVVRGLAASLLVASAVEASVDLLCARFPQSRGEVFGWLDRVFGIAVLCLVAAYGLALLLWLIRRSRTTNA